MLSRTQENQEKKRVLKKVRRDFLAKKLNGDETDLVDPSAKYISNTNTYTLDPLNGIVESNRKILLGPQYLNGIYKISSLLIEEQHISKPVVLSISGMAPAVNNPCEYTMKRLESYGDLELATWAHRIQKYSQIYPKKMAMFYETLNSDDPAIVEYIKDTKQKVRQTCAEIESNFIYYKVISHLRREAAEMTEIHYSESFLKELGYTSESFLQWVKNNGIPGVFEGDCSVYLQSVKKYFDESSVSDSYIRKGLEYETFLLDKGGLKKNIVVQNIIVVEVDPKDALIHNYFLVKSSSFTPNKGLPEEYSDKPFKQTKLESDTEGSQCSNETIMTENEESEVTNRVEVDS